VRASCPKSRSAPSSNPHSALAASQCPTARDFVPWRFLDASQLSARVFRDCRRPKTCTLADSCTAATGSLFDQLVSACEQRRRHRNPKRLCGRNIDDEIELGRLLDRDLSGLRPRRILSDEVGGARWSRSGKLGPYDIRPPASTYSRKL
jgi:hypothetical protein